MATWEDWWIGYRVKWLADQQLAGNGAVLICRACAGTGFDPDDPSDPCPVCRGPGAVLRSDLKPDIPAQEAAPSPEPMLMRWMRAFLG